MQFRANFVQLRGPLGVQALNNLSWRANFVQISCNFVQFRAISCNFVQSRAISWPSWRANSQQLVLACKFRAISCKVVHFRGPLGMQVLNKLSWRANFVQLRGPLGVQALNKSIVLVCKFLISYKVVKFRGPIGVQVLTQFSWRANFVQPRVKSYKLVARFACRLSISSLGVQTANIFVSWPSCQLSDKLFSMPMSDILASQLCGNLL